MNADLAQIQNKYSDFEKLTSLDNDIVAGYKNKRGMECEDNDADGDEMICIPILNEIENRFESEQSLSESRASPAQPEQSLA